MKPYLTLEELQYRCIAFIHCENEDSCGFVVEFKYPNCSFFFCKAHGTGINVDLSSVSDAGVVCELHGAMERYDLIEEDNICPRCDRTTLAIISIGV